jgi:ketol-acid reductoisomerase
VNVLHNPDVYPPAIRARRIVILGYGSQARAQALNLHDSGCDVTVALRAGSPSWPQAEQAGLRVCEIAVAVRDADIVMFLIPDETQPAVYEHDVKPNLRPGAYLGFAHGFAIHYRQIVAATETNVFLVAPKGIGPMVRQQYQAGSGVAALIAIHQDPSGDTRDMALAYAGALGCGRIGILETTFRDETETDLFGEQAVLCGGLVELIRVGFETLTAAGYPPEMAYFECLHEVKLITDLIYERGLAGMRRAVSRTAAFGGLTRGPRVIGVEARRAMKEMLAEIQSGEFAREWLAEYAAGKPRLTAGTTAEAAHPIEAVGETLRKSMQGAREPGGARP